MLTIIPALLVCSISPSSPRSFQSGVAPELFVALSAESMVVKEGYPLTFQITVTNAGPQPLTYPSGPKNGFWLRARVMHLAPDSEDDARPISVAASESVFVPRSRFRLDAGQSVSLIESLGYEATPGVPEPGKPWHRYEPLTNSPGVHSFWAEFSQAGVFVKSPVLRVRVTTAADGDAAALEFLRGMAGLPTVYRFGTDIRVHLDDLRVLAFEKGNNGYADLARMRLAEWHLFWVEWGDEKTAVESTNLSGEQNLQRAQELIESIALENYPIPGKLPAIKERLAAARKKGT